MCGRGTTDCLGHVVLVTELMRKLGQTKPQLKSTVVAVFIANEENSSILGVGIDALVKDGLLNKLKEGPLYVYSITWKFYMAMENNSWSYHLKQNTATQTYHDDVSSWMRFFFFLIFPVSIQVLD